MKETENDWFIVRLAIILVTGLIGYLIGMSFPVKIQTRPDPKKIEIRDSLDSCIEDLTKKKSMLENTIHWKQLELMDSINENK
jgi:hypothetical protein